MSIVPYIAAAAAESSGALTTIYGIGGGQMISAEAAGYGMGQAIVAEGYNYLRGKIKKRIYSSLKAGGENLKTKLQNYMDQPRVSNQLTTYKPDLSRDRGRPMNMMRKRNYVKGRPVGRVAWTMIQKRKKKRTNRRFY